MKTILAVASIWFLSSFVTVTTAVNDKCMNYGRESCYCKKEPLHTRCKTLDQTACCSEYQSAAPTQSDIQVILKRHNEIRNKVASGKEETCPSSECDGSPCQSTPLPSANTINELCWDYELAAIAQKLADTCVFGHEADYSYRADLCGRYDNVGQNIFWGANSDLTATKVDFLDSINSWYSELCRLPEQVTRNFSGSPDPNKAWGHYTQLIWDITRTVGCGAATYVCDGMINNIVVCNYGPGGNLEGAPIYETTTGVKCYTDKSYSSLCNCYSCLNDVINMNCDCTNTTSQYMGI